MMMILQTLLKSTVNGDVISTPGITYRFFHRLEAGPYEIVIITRLKLNRINKPANEI